MSLWFRAYCDALDNPKVQLLEPELFKAWFNIMALAKIMDGRIPSLSLVAFRLRIDSQTAGRYLAALSSEEVKLLDLQPDGSWIPHDWQHWQYESDTSTDRVRKFRKNKPSEATKEAPKDETVDGTFHETGKKRFRNGAEQSRAEQKQNNLSGEKPAGKEPVEISTDPVSVAVHEAAAKIHTRHPQARRDCSAAAVEAKLRAIIKRHCPKGSQTEKIDLLNQTDWNHAARCSSFDWQKDDGEFAKSLENWLAPTMDRYLTGDPRAPPKRGDQSQPPLNLAYLPGHMNPGLLTD